MQPPRSPVAEFFVGLGLGIAYLLALAAAAALAGQYAGPITPFVINFGLTAGVVGVVVVFVRRRLLMGAGLLVAAVAVPLIAVGACILASAR